ncbi:MAG TPA: hypothetical protein VGK63_10700 [Candidatus Limnocylindrales bacterium]
MTEPKSSDLPDEESIEPTDDEEPLTSETELFEEEAFADEPLEDADEALEEPLPPPGPVSRRPPAAPAAGRVPTPSEVAVHVNDRVSAAFVVLVAVVFAAILLWGLLGGHRGLFTPAKSPKPSPAPSASPSASVSGSPSASAAVSPSGSIVSPSPSGS